MIELQNQVLRLRIEDANLIDENVINTEKSIEEPYKKRKWNRSKEHIENDDIYEVENILDHMIDDNGQAIFFCKTVRLWPHT